MPKAAFLPAADADYDTARTWYFKRSARAAARFEEAVDQAVAEIVVDPERWPMIDAKHRLHLLRHFPYSIVYRVENELVIVVAVAHARRRFRYWKDR
jgi:plasmid stabilization system protein ParE